MEQEFATAYGMWHTEMGCFSLPLTVSLTVPYVWELNWKPYRVEPEPQETENLFRASRRYGKK